MEKYLNENPRIKLDEPVKSCDPHFSVIPAKAGNEVKL
jgi:hypothetical protein